MNISKEIISIISYVFLAFFAFFINYWTGSRGVFPIDTFVHFDSASRILNKELPIRDYWIVHGLFVDYLQSIFFKIFGINWQAYIIHGSIFNSIIAIFSFKIFKLFEINLLYAFLFSMCISILAYPVSGTPFLDLHSAFLSLFAMYFLLLFVKSNKSYNLFLAIIILGLAFLSKQVPAGYFIIVTGLFIFFYSYQIKSLNPLILSFLTLIFFIGTLTLYLFLTKTSFEDLLIQLFLFPIKIAEQRQANSIYNFKNIFLDYKYIYLFLLPISFIIFKKLLSKNFINTKEFSYFVIIFIFSASLIYHQILTKNQIFIFSLIPVLSSFLLYFLRDIKIKKKKYLDYLIVLLCLLITFKYHLRFNEQRKFHELSSTNINNAIRVDFKKNFFYGLKWITPNYRNPTEELRIIEDFYLLIKKDSSKKILITEYSFFSALLKESLHSPSRTYDNISYPTLKDDSFQIYNKFFKNNIIKNKIENIYIFFPSLDITSSKLNHFIFNYLPEDCYDLEHLSNYTKKIRLNKCDYLINEN
jgi:hypothetical protein